METNMNLRTNAAVIVVLFAALSCNPKKTNEDNGSPIVKVDHSENNTEAQWHQKGKSNIIKDQLVITFSDTVSNLEKRNEINKFRGWGVSDSCACGNLYLLEPLPDIRPEDAIGVTHGKPGQDGASFYNLDINMDNPPFRGNEKLAGNYDTITDYNQIIKVAVIDGGIPDDNELSNLLWVNEAESSQSNRDDSFDNDDNCYIDDVNGYDFTDSDGGINPHGSFISQILIKSLDNKYKIAFIDLRIFDSDGTGNLFDALCAIDYAINENANFINLSWGYYRDKKDFQGMHSDSLLEHYINLAMQNNIVIFASAGNDSLNTDNVEYHYPSGFFSSDPIYPNNLISIAALDSVENVLALYSNYGDRSVIIADKGTHDVSWMGSSKRVRGTSYATPQALGYSIILWESIPGSQPSTFKNCLINSVADDEGFILKTRGRINRSATSCQ